MAIAAFALLAHVPLAGAQSRPPDLAVEAPPSRASAADLVRNIDREALAAAFARAGLQVPPRIRVTLVPEEDPRSGEVPRWIVGQAHGADEVVIFPDRVGPYPYGSLESVVWHEVAHAALSVQAGGQPLPRWFHEGVAVSVEKEWGLASDARVLLATVRDPDLADLRRLFVSDAQYDTASAYLLAAALVSDVRERHGSAVPGAIVDRVAGGTPFARAFELETGVTPEQAAARTWGVYRRWTRWIPVMTSGSTIWIGIMLLSLIAFVATLRRRAARRRRWELEEME
ncbi:MAG: hypothetical protein ACRDF6_03805 [bacterium]